ncbi:hypothetical protein NQZ68_034208 [Dissostichus eleginoides]|nr:hypothetical protein NQZ68_034208 [Dissostichus eleginoides]
MGGCCFMIKKCYLNEPTQYKLLTVPCRGEEACFLCLLTDSYARVQADGGGSGRLSGTCNHMEDLQQWLHPKLATQA